MTKFTCDIPCGNSPRAEFVKEFNRWFTTEETDKILDHLHPDVRWEMVGEDVIEGVENVKKAFFNRDDDTGMTMTEMVVEGIITHGKEACSYGTMTMQDDKSRIVYRFCDLLMFATHAKDAKITHVTSFVTEIERN